VQLVKWAESTARERLAASLPRRWRHVQQVARRPETLAAQLAEDAELLVVSAWLHDIGYAPELAEVGFHPLDGARFLRAGEHDERLCGLVAFHSSALAEAEALDLADQLAAEFEDERTLTRDLLWFADMTTGPDGQCMSFEERMADVRDRYGPEHYVIRALEAGMAERAAAVARAEVWIESVGLAGQV
jgi:hypothetical protein